MASLGNSNYCVITNGNCLLLGVTVNKRNRAGSSNQPVSSSGVGELL